MKWLLPFAGVFSGILVGESLDPSQLTPWTAVGLLSGILSWYLFVRTPAVDKMMREKDAAYAQLVKDKDEAHAKALNDKDEQLDTNLVHKWASIETMTKEETIRGRTLAETFNHALIAQAEHCERTEERLIAFFEGRAKHRPITHPPTEPGES